MPQTQSDDWNLPAAKGTYALVLFCPQRCDVQAGGLGKLEILPGWYLYVGSAFGPGGLRARCGRHLRGGRPHWHMDYLRPVGKMEAIWMTEDTAVREHLWAQTAVLLRGAAVPFPGFGASDCGCESHLLRFGNPPSFAAFKRRIRRSAVDHGRIFLRLAPVAAGADQAAQAEMRLPGAISRSE